MNNESKERLIFKLNKLMPSNKMKLIDKALDSSRNEEYIEYVN